MNTLSMDEKMTSMDHDSPYVIKDDMPAPLIERIHYVMEFFPELKHQDIVFCWKPNAVSYAGQYEFKKRQVNIAPSGDSIYTVAHELTHAVQFIFRTLPYGERSCDIWTMARSHELIDKLPYYVRVPRAIKTDGWQHLLHSLANEAIEKRAKGLKNYISWFESELQNVLWVKQEAQELLGDTQANNEALHQARGLLVNLEEYEHIIKQIDDEISKNNRWIGRLQNILQNHPLNQPEPEGCQ